ncbi:MAG: Lrp/AsnC family transcriptional regulator [Clostridia bacterium]|nr:Lrp/AsnC family transcriptional regulator [Clostridia bacterium]
MEELDRTEKEMILLLQADGRMSFVDMAKAIGVTEGTIRRKFNRLVEEGIIHIAAIADPFKVGYETPAFIGIRTESSHIDEVCRRLAALPRLRYVAASTGEYDIICEGYFASNQELSQFIIEELGQIPGIKETTTTLVLQIYKQSLQYGLADYRPHSTPIV